MSRSRRRTPIIGIACCNSEKADKMIWHGRMRAHERQLYNQIHTGADLDALLHPLVGDVSNPWSMGKDGRQRLDLVRDPHFAKYMRK